MNDDRLLRVVPVTLMRRGIVLQSFRGHGYFDFIAQLEPFVLVVNKRSYCFAGNVFALKRDR
jgi:hypothetical protein